ncbi:uncharacterized protein LOC143803736 [Ranitomeya variabilis]|uniref:uncharacterized protein LOC143803736 n=1 Tax=Ranitomeya variabilis TaxID=490064 RepID=UPI004055B20C
MDQVVLRHLWVEVAKSLWDGFESASSSEKSNFVKKLRTRWRSMKDRFNKGIRAEEEQSRSGAAAAKSVPYKYNRALQFLRPILGRRQTHSSTLERARPAGADLHESPSDPSQPSHSDSRLAPPSGEPAAGPSGVPLPDASGAPSFGNSRQRQRASDRPAMPEFLHLSTVFQNGFKALGDKMDTRLSNIDQRLENMESELSRPAKHFFSTIAKGMVEHLTPELQISVMQACNTAYVRAPQQARVMQSATMPRYEEIVYSKAQIFQQPWSEEDNAGEWQLLSLEVDDDETKLLTSDVVKSTSQEDHCVEGIQNPCSLKRIHILSHPVIIMSAYVVLGVSSRSTKDCLGVVTADKA